MRIRWDDKKYRLILKDRKINFSNLEELLCLPYIEDQKNDDPEQYRIIGFIKGRLVSFVVEYRYDEIGEFIWIVTAWQSTKQEQKAYEKHTR